MTELLSNLNPKEKKVLVGRIQALIDFWDITTEELLADAPPPPPAPPGPAKYRHPVHGDTWDGQGTHPEWLRKALLKEGYTVDELRRAAACSTAAG
jgi:DNA-binding protein H-NS